MRYGIVGMGVGTLACFGRPGDSFRFYEINPDVIRFAEGDGGYFSYLRDSPAEVFTVLGDARLSLEREAARGEQQKFDVLVLDAFNSDSVPVHLLTEEAFGLYLEHLRGPESVIAVNITNRSLDLQPLLLGIAARRKLEMLTVAALSVEWVLLARDPRYLRLEQLYNSRKPVPDGAQPIVWTDDYSNLLELLR